MTQDETLNLILKKKELWMKGKNAFTEALRLQRNLKVYISSTTERIEELSNEAKMYLDEMQKIAEQLDSLELE